MANEKRLRLLSVTTGGNVVTLGASLSSHVVGHSDTITLNGTLEYADGAAVSIGTDQYLPIVVDPNTAIAEEIWLTTTPSGSPVTATAIRGVGSSTGAPAHSSGASVVAPPTPYDRLASYDDPWGGNLGYDYEFQGDTTSLPSYSFNGSSYSWSWLNQGSATYTEAWGAGMISVPGSSSTEVRGIYLSTLPTPTFTATAKIIANMDNSNFAKAGLMLTNGTAVYAVEAYAGSQAVCVEYYTAVTTYNSAPFGSTSVYGPITYFQIQYVSTSSVTTSVSTDGRNWWTLISAGSMSFTPSYVGIMGDSENSKPVNLSCQFFRVR